MNNLTTLFKNNYRTIFSVSALVIVFFISIQQSYILFHTVIELFSIVVAFAVFIVTWNSRKMQDNNYLYFVGIAYFSIAALDLLHTLTFKGMNIISSESFYANQFWIATRLLEAITFVVGFVFIGRHKKLNADLIFLTYFLVTILIAFSILVWKIFPVCFIEGIGQTTFKIYAEYTIIAILVVAGYLLKKNRHHFSKPVYDLLMASLIFTGLSEFCFTLYVSNYSPANEIGHYAKLIAFFLIYKANVDTGFTAPTNLIFKNLKDNEEKYRTLAVNLRVAEQQLQELNATKDKLFSIVAHDLRNPFTSLITFSELIYKNADKLEKEKIGQIALRMNESSKQAYNLLENLLNWSRVQTGMLKANPQPVSVLHLLTEAERFATPLSQAKNIRISVDSVPDVIVYTDQQLINTVLRNLIGNAIKFSYPESEVKLSVQQQENDLVIAIADSGVGISKEVSDQLLSVGNRHSTKGTASEKGTGLGLVLCKEFVELNGGKLWLESQFGVGTTFYFTLPLSSQ